MSATQNQPLPSACTACQAPLAPGLDRCPRCGRHAGRQYHCPYCLVQVDLVRSKTLGHACAICGRAGIPLDDPSIQRSYAELPVLDRANRLRISRLLWRIAAYATAAFATFALLVATMVALAFDPNAPIVVLSALGFVVPVVATLLFFRGARKADAKLRDALHEARRSVAMEVVRAYGEFDLERIARLLRLDAAEARTVAAALVEDPATLDLLEGQRWLRLEKGLSPSGVEGTTELAEPGTLERSFRKRQP